MQSGPAEIVTSDKPKALDSLGTHLFDAIKPHHKHKHKHKDNAAKKEVDVSAVVKIDNPEPKKKHHHHGKKKHDEKEKKHHRHHHRHQETTLQTAAKNIPDVSPVAIKAQTPALALEPLASPLSEENKILKAMTTKDPVPAAIFQTISCEKCPPLLPAKKATWSELAQEYLPGVRLLTPLFALHRQAGQDWVNDVGNALSRFVKLEGRTEEEVVSGYKEKLRPRSK
ncbi:MAG: hypothetical protein HYX61_01210 [Gammaproteobacteria bacterium]|nr:hypothetical protein [Gammaproteobacteria bacterium]